MLRLRSIGAGLALCANLASPALAQTGWRVVVDNDYLNFWESPEQRADRDYTHGVELGFTTSHIPGFAAWLARDASGARDPDASFAMNLKQQIFTPSSWDGVRPCSGWLGVSALVRRESDNAYREIGLELGVTGSPSLAEPTQRWFHHTFGFDPPEGWDSQLPFEPAITLDYHSARELVNDGSVGEVRFRAGPQWGGQIGNRVTGLSGGFASTFGLRPPAPWSVTDRGSSGVSLFASCAVRMDLVVYDQTLDGTLFHSSRSVSKYPDVMEVEDGLGAGYKRVKLEWRVVRRATEYRSEPGPHTYSTIALSLAGR